MEYYRLVLYAIFGILPSLVWLFYYLRKDLHPEPKQMILRVFLWGMLATIPALFFQIFLSLGLDKLQYFSLLYWSSVPPFLSAGIVLVKWFLVIALSEEVAKYLVVRGVVFGSRELDEPLDLMLYMVVAALGFAALENFLYLFSPINSVSADSVLQITITISFLRFIGATFLHTICAALVGYFMAVSSLRGKYHRFRMTIVGIALATLLHGLYDFSIINLEYPLNVIVPVLIIFSLAAFMVFNFNRIKKIKGLVKI